MSGSLADANGMVPLAEPINRWWRAPQWVGVVYALFVIWSDVEWILVQRGVTSHGDYGVVFMMPLSEAAGTARLARLMPGGPAAKAGFREGDEVTATDRWGLARSPAPGEQITLVRLSGGDRKPTTLTAVMDRAPLVQGDPVALATSILAWIPTSLFGLLILLRSRGRPAAVSLGLGLAAFGLGLWYPTPPSLGWPPLTPLIVGAGTAGVAIQAALLMYCGIELLSRASGARHRGLLAIPLVWAAIYLLQPTLWAAGMFGLPLGAERLDTMRQWARFMGDALVPVFFILAWLRSTGNERKRLTVLTLAMCLLTAAQFPSDLTEILFPEDFTKSLKIWWFVAAEFIAGGICPLVLAYGILKDRILDIGFAVNRTLVYSLVSAILLGAFGLIEWGADHFLKIEGREKNALIDAAIALAVFLTFHRVRDFVERAVEALFFRSWQEKEARLRRFVAEAAFITDQDALLQGMIGALSRFADAATAIYLATDRGSFERVAGSLSSVADELGENDPAIVTLRAERKSVEPSSSGSTLEASLCAPMTYGSDVRGFVLFGAKPEGVDFRPDEIELIGWATVQVGLDLHALRIERLQDANATLRHENALLRSLIPRPA